MLREEKNMLQNQGIHSPLLFELSGKSVSGFSLEILLLLGAVLE